MIGLFPRESVTSASAQAPAYPPLTDQQRADLRVVGRAAEGRHGIPNEGAKVLIVKFSDYMCPACRNTYKGTSRCSASISPAGRSAMS